MLEIWSLRLKEWYRMLTWLSLGSLDDLAVILEVNCPGDLLARRVLDIELEDTVGLINRTGGSGEGGGEGKIRMSMDYDEGRLREEEKEA